MVVLAHDSAQVRTLCDRSLERPPAGPSVSAISGGVPQRSLAGEKVLGLWRCQGGACVRHGTVRSSATMTAAAAKAGTLRSMAGKTVLITGSTDGIGLHTATELAKLGATVLIHGRNPSKAKAAVKKIEAESGNTHIEHFTADLSRLSDVRRLGTDVLASHPSITHLINNAGIFAERFRRTEDGHEETWAVNVLAPFLLTALLFDAATDGIINVSSISAASRLDLETIDQERGFSTHDAYAQSKLAVMMFTVEQARRTRDGATANCLDPGTVNTKLLYEGWGPIGIPIESANDELKLATSPIGAEVNGGYFVGGRKHRYPRVVHDAKARHRLWELLEEQTGATYPPPVREVDIS